VQKRHSLAWPLVALIEMLHTGGWIFPDVLSLESEGVMKLGIRKRIRIGRNTIYSRSGGVTLAIQES
jgi:hypothetical protein